MRVLHIISLVGCIMSMHVGTVYFADNDVAVKNNNNSVSLDDELVVLISDDPSDFFVEPLRLLRPLKSLTESIKAIINEGKLPVAALRLRGASAKTLSMLVYCLECYESKRPCLLVAELNRAEQERLLAVVGFGSERPTPFPVESEFTKSIESCRYSKRVRGELLKAGVSVPCLVNPAYIAANPNNQEVLRERQKVELFHSLMIAANPNNQKGLPGRQRVIILHSLIQELNTITRMKSSSLEPEFKKAETEKLNETGNYFSEMQSIKYSRESKRLRGELLKSGVSVPRLVDPGYITAKHKNKGKLSYNTCLS